MVWARSDFWLFLRRRPTGSSWGVAKRVEEEGGATLDKKAVVNEITQQIRNNPNILDKNILILVETMLLLLLTVGTNLRRVRLVRDEVG